MLSAVVFNMSIYYNVKKMLPFFVNISGDYSYDLYNSFAQALKKQCANIKKCLGNFINCIFNLTLDKFSKKYILPVHDSSLNKVQQLFLDLLFAKSKELQLLTESYS